VLINNKNRISARLLLGGCLLLSGGAAPGHADSDQCGARVLLTDLDTNLRNFAISPGVDTPIGETARVSILPEPNAPQPPLAVWENGQGQFRKVSRGTAPVPLGAVRLHVLTAQGKNDDLTAFDTGLSEDFGDAVRPWFIPSHGKRKRRNRGVDDDVRSYHKGSLPAARQIPPPSSQNGAAQGAEVMACEFEFSARGPGGDPSQ
jgi:hypothetical protein